MNEILGMFQGLANGFSIAFSVTNLLFALIGALLGTIVGILSGLGPAATISSSPSPQFQDRFSCDLHHHDGRDFLWGHVWWIDHIHPGQYSWRSSFCGHLH